jgi:cation diffusion facilitator CzcD-associated flavoprotein CzcO
VQDEKMAMTEVAIVGAGPYGLSIASHLRARGIEHRIFGEPMRTWRTAMPQGMFLKSDGFASNVWDPSGRFTLRHYCEARGLPYKDTGLPVSREIFADYGADFAAQCVPHLEREMVREICEAKTGFRLTLESGETLTARRVILAVGISHFADIPKALSALSPSVVSHSSRNPDLGIFAGREMIVLGAGASALDCAALLAGAGASVKLVARAPKIHFHDGPTLGPRPLMDRLRAPSTGLGPGWRSKLCTDAPLLFHRMPERFRLLVIKKHLGPAPGWWTRDMVETKVAFHLGQSVESAAQTTNGVAITLAGADGARSVMTADHLIAATGYRPNIRSLGFLSPSLQARLRTAGDAPALSMNFESSVPGLFFTGLAAANSFGPMLRFAYGAGFTARRLTRHIGATTRKSVSFAARGRRRPVQAEEVLF